MNIVFKMRPMPTLFLVVLVGALIGHFCLHVAARRANPEEVLLRRCKFGPDQPVDRCIFHITYGVPLKTEKLDCCKEARQRCPPIYCSVPGFASCDPPAAWCKKYIIKDWQPLVDKIIDGSNEEEMN